MPAILSKTKLSAFRKFLQKKTREKEGRFWVEGWHLIDEAMKSGRRLHALVYDPDTPREGSENEILARATSSCLESYEGSRSQLAQLSDTRTSQGVLALVDSVGSTLADLLTALPPSGPIRLVLLDELGDPGNCGSIIRASDWFGLDGVVMGSGCAELENGKTSRSTMGGLFHLPIAVGVDLEEAVGKLQEMDVRIFTTELDETALSLSEFEFPERCALIIGNEARGVRSNLSKRADGKLFAPRFGKGESLNAAAAAAVFMAKWRV